MNSQNIIAKHLNDLENLNEVIVMYTGHREWNREVAAHVAFGRYFPWIDQAMYEYGNY